MKELKDTITTAAEPCTEDENNCMPKIDGGGKADFAKQSADQCTPKKDGDAAGGFAKQSAEQGGCADENERKPVSIVLKETEEGTIKVSIEGDCKETFHALLSAIVIAFLNYTEGMEDEMRMLMAGCVGADVVRSIREKLLAEDTDGDEAEEEEVCKPQCKGCCHGCGEEHTVQP